jgi:D-threonine aldolase
MNWYHIKNIDHIDSPALILYKDRIAQNNATAIKMVRDVSLLRPHVKTHKMAEVCELMKASGITKFKCATIAEAEMLAIIQAEDVLLAYQPVGPKADRFLSLIKKYPHTKFSCLVDNFAAAQQLSRLFSENVTTLPVFIDLNTGMNRSGIKPSDAFALVEQLQTLKIIYIKGLHAYDGHLNDASLAQRQEKSDAAFEAVRSLATQLENRLNRPTTIVAGGSPTFPTHTNRDVECSPGTYIFWDWGYKHQLPDAPFEYAALVVTRVVSIIDSTTMTTDLGHKSVAAENPLPRVHFLNAPDVKPIGQSEEHLVLHVTDSTQFAIGDVLYGVPVHICPTVALYEKAIVVENNEATDTWQVTARNRVITI